MSHTQGPWVMEGRILDEENPAQLTGFDVYSRVKSEQYVWVASILGEHVNVPREEIEPNARLIAAAPDLLEAAKRQDLDCRYDVLNPCWDNRPTDVIGKHWGGDAACFACHLKAAIAKAEGR